MSLARWLAYVIHGRTSRAPRKRRLFYRGPVRDARYKAWIRTLPCLVCGCYGSEAAHTGDDGGMRQKSSDHSCVPLCAECHTLAPGSYHQVGKEEFERQNGLVFSSIVKELNQEWNAMKKAA